MDATDLTHLHRCVALARVALEKGHQPFGSILVGADGQVLFEGHNETGGGDSTRHPELALARWAAETLSPEARAAATVYTSGEHCPMCAAAHGWVGLGRIVYAASASQFFTWLGECGAPPPPVRPLPIAEILPDAVTEGPVEALADEIRALHRRAHAARVASP